jgi:hypothetical protein
MRLAEANMSEKNSNLRPNSETPNEKNDGAAGEATLFTGGTGAAAPALVETPI